LTRSSPGSATSSSSSPPLAEPALGRVGRDGALALSLERRGPRTVLAGCRSTLPLQVLAPVALEDPAAVVWMLNPTGGLLGGLLRSLGAAWARVRPPRSPDATDPYAPPSTSSAPAAGVSARAAWTAHPPARRTPDWFALAMLDQALHGGRAGRIHRRLVLEKQVAVDTEGGIQYPVGNLFDYNGPTLMVTRILHKPEYSAEKTLETYDEVIGEVQEQGVSEDELEQVKVKFRSDYFSMLEGGMGGYMPRYGLMHLLACFALFDGEPGLVNTILDGFQKVTRARLQTAAQKFLVPSNRSIVLRQPVQKGTA